MLYLGCAKLHTHCKTNIFLALSPLLECVYVCVYLSWGGEKSVLVSKGKNINQ